jgi:hypothetical protein
MAGEGGIVGGTARFSMENIEQVSKCIAAEFGKCFRLLLHIIAWDELDALGYKKGRTQRFYRDVK